MEEGLIGKKMKFWGEICCRSVCRAGTVMPLVFSLDEFAMVVSHRGGMISIRVEFHFQNKVSFLSPWVERSEFTTWSFHLRPGTHRWHLRDVSPHLPRQLRLFCGVGCEGMVGQCRETKGGSLGRAVGLGVPQKAHRGVQDVSKGTLRKTGHPKSHPVPQNANGWMQGHP